MCLGQRLFMLQYGEENIRQGRAETSKLVRKLWWLSMEKIASTPEGAVGMETRGWI